MANVPTGKNLNSLLPKNIRKAGVLEIATDPTFPPYEYYKGTKLTGYEPALMEALGKVLAIKIKIVPAGFNELIPGVQAGRFEVAMSGISDLPSREKQVTFVDYGKYETSIVVSASNPGHITGNALTVCGRSLSGQYGTITVTDSKILSANCKKHHLSAVHEVLFPDAGSTFLAVTSGRVDGQIQDYIEAYYELAQAPGRVKLIPPYSVLPRGPLGIITKRNATQLDHALLAGIKAMRADGAYQRIYKTWHIPSAELASPGINLGSH
ncbi:MAG: ABC transporter substrate-binding protein [Acidimicrobiales bacterium]